MNEDEPKTFAVENITVKKSQKCAAKTSIVSEKERWEGKFEGATNNNNNRRREAGGGGRNERLSWSCSQNNQQWH